jgi:hypothetical protein
VIKLDHFLAKKWPKLATNGVKMAKIGHFRRNMAKKKAPKKVAKNVKT